MVNAYSRSGDLVDGIKLGEFGTMLMKIGVLRRWWWSSRM
jgi:hypothetical protein